jgi:hypothetical protein
MKTCIPLSVFWLITTIHVAITFTSSAAVPCNSFPKIFGGSSGFTFVNQIDVFDDYLAFAGGTIDSGLTQTSSIKPYITLTSISINKYFWSKAFN